MEHWKVQPYDSVATAAAAVFFERGYMDEVGPYARRKIVDLWKSANWREEDQNNLPAGKGAAKIWKRIQRNLADVYFYWGVAEMMETGAAEVTWSDYDKQTIKRYVEE